MPAFSQLVIITELLFCYLSDHRKVRKFFGVKAIIKGDVGNTGKYLFYYLIQYVT